MNLLEQIQNEAVDSKSDLSSLLRKCKLFSARLGSQELEDWLVWESNGYPQEVKIPEYRSWSMIIKGHFSGAFGSGTRNATIPPACIPQKYRENATKFNCRMSIASIEKSVAENESGYLQISNSNLVIILGDNVIQDQNCIQSWGQFSIGNYTEVLNAVRNKVLDFSIALWKEIPSIGDTNPKKIESGKVTQIFNTTVYGGNANLVGSANQSTITFNCSQGNWDELKAVLENNDVEQEDISELHKAIMEDPAPSDPIKFGPNVSNWLANMFKKSASGLWNVGISVAGNLLSESLKSYYGM
jgi:hypothetical protein